MTIPIQTTYEHIALDDGGIPYIVGTRIKVVHLAAEQVNLGWSAEEIAYQHPPLTLGQVFSALAYYWDHKAEIDGQMRASIDYVTTMRKTLPTFPRLAELQARYETE